MHNIILLYTHLQARLRLLTQIRSETSFVEVSRAVYNVLCRPAFNSKHASPCTLQFVLFFVNIILIGFCAGLKNVQVI